MAEVLCFRTRALFRGRVRDLSESGCFVDTRAQLKFEAMALVEVTIQIRGLQLKTLACARSIQPGKGAGFEFVSRDPRLREPLLRMIAQVRNAPSAPAPTSESVAAGIPR